MALTAGLGTMTLTCGVALLGAAPSQADGWMVDGAHVGASATFDACTHQVSFAGWNTDSGMSDGILVRAEVYDWATGAWTWGEWRQATGWLPDYLPASNPSGSAIVEFARGGDTDYEWLQIQESVENGTWCAR